MSEYDAIIQDLQRSLEAMTADRDSFRKEMFSQKALAERIHELVFTNYEFSNDITEVIMDIENEQAGLQYHVDVCRDSGLVPSRVPFTRLGE